MPIVRPSTGLLRSSPSQSSSVVRQASARGFQSSVTRNAGHAPHYDPPGGWLWGVAPGTKAKREGWERPMYWGFCGGMGLTIVAYIFKPDTSIQTWALEEARRRLEAEGILEDPEAKN